MKKIYQQAIEMLATEDLSKWSQKHDEATIDALREAIKREEAQPAETCLWTEDDPDYTPDTYASACGELWSFIDGGPAKNNFRFCHGCGKPIQIVETS